MRTDRDMVRNRLGEGGKRVRKGNEYKRKGQRGGSVDAGGG